MFVGGAAALKSVAVIARQGAEKLGADKVQVTNLYFHQWRLLIVLQSQKAAKAKEIVARAAEKEAKKAKKASEKAEEDKVKLSCLLHCFRQSALCLFNSFCRIEREQKK